MNSVLRKSLGALDALVGKISKSEESQPLETNATVSTVSDSSASNEQTAQGNDSENNADINKSLEEPAKDSETLEKSSGGIEFLDEKFEDINTAVNSLANVLQKSMIEQDDTMTVFAKSFTAIAQTNALMADMMKSVNSQVTEFNQRMTILEGQPQMRKSFGDINMFDKNFQKSSGLPQTQLSKSQISDILSDELFKGNPNVTKQDILSIESGAPLRSEVQLLLQNRMN